MAQRLGQLMDQLRRQQSALGELLASQSQEERPTPALQEPNEHDRRVLHQALKEQGEGLAHLRDIIELDLRDLGIMSASEERP